MNDLDYCRRCGSEKLVKRGKVFNVKKTLWRQQYFCKHCAHKYLGKEQHMADSYAPPAFVYQDKQAPPIDWTAYNEAQLNEKELFLELLTGVIGLVWRKLWLYFKEQPQNYFEHYHKRSNVETTFSMIKRKFGSSLMTKTLTANTNEILCKVIVHNICCLISAYYELGLEKAFCTKAQEINKISILV